MEEPESTFQSVIEAEQQNCGTNKKPLAENGNHASNSNQEQDMDKAIKRRKVGGSWTIDICVEARAEAYGENLTEREVYTQGGKSTDIK